MSRVEKGADKTWAMGGKKPEVDDGLGRERFR